jgi:hypothetical protein
MLTLNRRTILTIALGDSSTFHRPPHFLDLLHTFNNTRSSIDCPLHTPMTKNRRHANITPESLHPMTDRSDAALFEDDGFSGGGNEGDSAFRGDD